MRIYGVILAAALASALAGAALPPGIAAVGDYSWMRGVCYEPHPEAQVRRELGYGRRVGLNMVRFWMDIGTWHRRGEAYLKELDAFLRVCHDCGYGVMPVLFNGNGDSCVPGRLDPEKWGEGEEYLRAVVAAFKDNPGLMMWDLMNEPACNGWNGQAGISSEERQRRAAKLWRFTGHMAAYLKELDPVTPLTIGSTIAAEAQNVVDQVDVISFHDYGGTRDQIEGNYALAAKLGKESGKPVIQTETGCLARANPYELALETCERHHFGWVLFELVIRGRCDSEHGIFYPDGTVRDPATIAAMMGCYRNRNLATMVVPVPNREGMAERCINEIKRALSEYTSDAFDYRPSDVRQLLEACERAANLLEACDMVPMAVPPTARIEAWRKMERPPLGEVRAFAYDLAQKLRGICQIL